MDQQAGCNTDWQKRGARTLTRHPPEETIQEQFRPEGPFAGLIQITGLNNYLWVRNLSCKDIVKFLARMVFLSILREPGEGRGGVPLQNPEITSRKACLSNAECPSLGPPVCGLMREDLEAQQRYFSYRALP